MAHAETIKERIDDVSWEFFKALKQNVDDMAESHIEAWKERYKDKDMEGVSTDLYINHDLCIEVERVEGLIDSPLSPTERKWLQIVFNETVLDKLRWRAKHGS